MADVAIAPERVTKTGLTATYTGTMLTTNTYTIRNTGRSILHFLNAGGSDCVITFQTPALLAGLGVAELVVTVIATTGDTFIGPFPPAIFNNGANDLKFTMDFITSVTVAVLEL